MENTPQMKTRMFTSDPKISTGVSDQPYPLISVVVPIYNGASDLDDLIQCLVDQSYPHKKLEVILVNNGSHDQTQEKIENLLSRSQEFKLNLIGLEETSIQSSYAARNRGIRQAVGEILVFTDVDCRPDPFWLERLITPFSSPDVGLVAGEILPLAGSTFWEWYAERRKILSQSSAMNHPFLPFGQTANLAVRRSIFQEIGLFRPYLTTGGDADLCWRIQLDTSYRFLLQPDAIVRHRHRNTFRSLQSQHRRYGLSHRVLQELHGFEPLHPLTPLEYLGLFFEWLFNEVPKICYRILRKKVPPQEILVRPITLMTRYAMDQGQKQAQIPRNVELIEYL